MTSKILTKEDYERLSADEYEGKTIRIFLSYSSINKRLAGEIKTSLKRYGLSVFLAHDDIQPTREWQNEISNNLIGCDVFIPVLTRSFSNSEWTDQETGIAFGLKKMILPLKVNMDPHGFISKFQACKWDSDNVHESCLRIINVLRDNNFNESLIDCLIRSLEKAYSFDSATKIIEQLEPFEKLFNAEQVNQIIRVSIRNNQVRMCNLGSKFLKSIVEDYGSIINPYLLTTFNKVKDIF